MDSPGLEYKTLENCYPEVVACLQLSPSEIAAQLRPSGILPDKDWSFLSNSHHDDDEKARRVADVVLTQVKIDPQVYSTFLEALKAVGSWTKSALTKLEETYTSLSSKGKTMYYVEKKHNSTAFLMIS